MQDILQNLKNQLGERFIEYALPEVKWSKDLRDVLQEQVRQYNESWKKVAYTVRKEAFRKKKLCYKIKALLVKTGALLQINSELSFHIKVKIKRNFM